MRNATATVTPALTSSARPGRARTRRTVSASTAVARRHRALGCAPAALCVGVAGSFTSQGRRIRWARASLHYVEGNERSSTAWRSAARPGAARRARGARDHGLRGAPQRAGRRRPVARRARARDREPRRDSGRRALRLRAECRVAQRAGARRARVRPARRRSAAAACRSRRWPPCARRWRCSRATRGAPARRSARSRSPCCCCCPPASGRSSRSAPSCSRCRSSPPVRSSCAAEARAPSRRIWLLVPLLALWGNLHGAVLTGAAVAGAYLVFERSRRRPGESAARRARVRARAVRQSGALGHPELRARRPAQRGRAPVLRPVGAARPPRAGSTSRSSSPASPSSPARCAPARSRGSSWRSRASPLLTLHAARGGVWLALFAVPLAAAGFGGRGARRGRLHAPRPAAGVRADRDRHRRHRARAARERCGRRGCCTARSRSRMARRCWPRMCSPSRSPTQGGRVWMANPIDAFSTRGSARLRRVDARAAGRATRALAHAPRAVLVRLGGKAERRLRANAASAASPPTRAPCSTRASRADGRGARTRERASARAPGAR